MSDIIVFEKHKTRDGTASVERPSLTIVLQVQGTDDETEVDAAVDAAALTTYNGLTRQSWTRDNLGGGVWDVPVLYNGEDLKGPGFVGFSGDNTAGTFRRTQSYETITSRAIEYTGEIDINGDPVTSPIDPPDYRGAIGVTDNAVEGVDVLSPKFEFTVQVIASRDALDSDFLVQLYHAEGKTNDAPFEIEYQGQSLLFDTRELRYDGGPHGYRNDGTWEFNFKFSASRNAQPEELNVGGRPDPTIPGGFIGGITFPEKKGWDYLWVRYKQRPLADAFVNVPVAVYVERVTLMTDFDALFNRSWTA